MIGFLEERWYNLCGATASTEDHHVFSIEINIVAPTRRVKYVALKVIAPWNRRRPWIRLYKNPYTAHNHFSAHYFFMQVHRSATGIGSPLFSISGTEIAGARNQVLERYFPLCVGLNPAEFFYIGVQVDVRG
jgi:hypothetical protein